MREKKDIPLFDEDKNYAEAKRLIEECRKKESKKLDLSKLNLKEIPPEIAELQFLEELDITRQKKIPEFIGNIVSLKKLFVGNYGPPWYDSENIILPPEQ